MVKKLIVHIKGGPSSGNYGHAGRPGLVGGSGGHGGVSLPNTAATDYAKTVAVKAGIGLEYIASAYAMTVEDYARAVEKEMEKQLAVGAIKIRLSEHTLGQVLDFGEFRNTFDTGKSSSEYGANGLKYSNYLQERAKLESEMFNVSEGAPGSERPLYGFFETPQGRSGTRFDSYGNTTIVLNDVVKSRAMYTDGDSLDYGRYNRFVPALVTAPSVRASLFLTNIGDPLSWWQKGIDNVGVEAQIFGGVRVSDISNIQFDSAPKSAALISRLDKIGIPWSIRSD